MYVPCARPTAAELMLGPSVTRSSTATVSPNARPGMDAWGGPAPQMRRIAVCPGPAITSGMYSRMCTGRRRGPAAATAPAASERAATAAAAASSRGILFAAAMASGEDDSEIMNS
uniref:Uncharacterized protein n=1 Tax=Oryza meridionalis TaxID=40149 RepID=A0A0E0EL07_9ORYZ